MSNSVDRDPPEKAAGTHPTAGESEKPPPSLWGWHTLLSLGITIAILGFLATRLDLARIRQEVTQANAAFLVLGALAHYATYPLRGARWRRCLIHLPVRCGSAGFSLLLFFYNAVDNVVPAKLGDVYGAHLARINCGIPRSSALGSLVFLRMIDAWVVLLVALTASWAIFAAKLPSVVMWTLIGGGIIALAVTGVILLFFILRVSLPGWVMERIEAIIRGFQAGMWPRKAEILPVVMLTTAIWALETLWIYLLTLGFGTPLDWTGTLFLTMIPLLASAFPLTPSGAGVVDVTFFSCLRMVGTASPLAMSVTVVNRFIDYWLHIGLGLLVWAFRQRLGIRTVREGTAAKPAEPAAPGSPEPEDPSMCDNRFAE
jgi:uncharacterized protein (TIRG00374 family)